MMGRRQGDVARQALAYVTGHRVATLATYGPEGLWAAAVFYANEGWRLIFLSARHTRHCQNLAANPRLAATIQEDYEDWPQIKGIQLEGAAHELMGEERARAIALYLEKYPFLNSPVRHIAEALKKVSWYLLVPDRLYFIDNSKGFGHRDKIVLDEFDGTGDA